MLEMNWVPIVAAVVVKKEAWAKIPASLAPALADVARATGENVRTQSRAEDEKAITALRQRGVKTHALTRRGGGRMAGAREEGQRDDPRHQRARRHL